MGDRRVGCLGPGTCRMAAAVLDHGPGTGPDGAEAEELLAALGYRSARDASAHDTATLDNRRALLRLAGRLNRLFLLSPPDAPNLAFVGGEAEPGLAGGQVGPGGTVSLAGAGLSFGQAFERCVGEAAEYLSQIGSGTDIACRGRPQDVPHGLDPDPLSDLLAMDNRRGEAAQSDMDWVAGRCLSGGNPILLPAGLCLRQAEAAQGPAPVTVGVGCAAGPTGDAAVLAAVLELIERDAAALWWVGGRPPRPISLETGAAAGAEALLGQVRGAAATRHTRLLDITTDTGIPSVASVSLSNDGTGFACGLAAGLTIGSAVGSAIVEMCQMELSHHVIALKRRQRGDGALNAHDLAHLERGRVIGADCPLLQPKGRPNDWPGRSGNPATEDRSPGAVLRRIEDIGAKLFSVDLTRDRFSIPVAKVVATGLQQYPLDIETSRLAQTIEKHGGGYRSDTRIPLL